MPAISISGRNKMSANSGQKEMPVFSGGYKIAGKLKGLLNIFFSKHDQLDLAGFASALLLL